MSALWILKNVLRYAETSKVDKKQQKQDRVQEKQVKQDLQRQTNPNGMLELALKGGVKRHSFTAADPARFYQEHKHDSYDGYKPRTV